MRITDNTFVLGGSYFAAVDNSSALGDIYGIRTKQGVILIDCGMPVSGPIILRETLDTLKLDEPITHLIITHAHIDHCGGAKELQDAGAKVIVGKEDVAYCEDGGFEKLDPVFYQGHVFPEFSPDIVIDNDQIMDINGINFEFIKIPGHSPGSMAIRAEIDGRSMLFTGDSLQPDGMYLSNVSFGWEGDPAYNRKLLVSSISKLMDVDAEIILPGHGRVCLRNGPSLLKYAAQVAQLTL